MTESPIGNVSDTAFLIAQYRAEESARPDALFHDPFAARLAGKKGIAIVKAFNRPVTSWATALRTLVIDDFIREGVAAGADTVLNLGAGLDTRPYRLELPKDLVWIEADYPNVISYKAGILAGESPNCKLETVSLDLGNDEERRSLLTEVGQRSGNLIVLTEGVVIYLDNDNVAALADELRELTSTTRVSWIVEFLPTRLFHRLRKRKQRMKNAPFKFNPGDWFGFFARHGWRPEVIRYMGVEGKKIGRPAPLPWRTRLTIMALGILKRRKGRGANHLFGYAVLVPVTTGIDS